MQFELAGRDLRADKIDGFGASVVAAILLTIMCASFTPMAHVPMLVTN